MNIIELEVREVIAETPDAVTIVFENPAGGKVFYKPGQFFTVIMDVAGKEERRSYSLSSSLATDNYPAITVKKVSGGRISAYLTEKIKAGDKLKVGLPMGHFTIECDSKLRRKIVLIGGGSGITPLISIAKTVLVKEPLSKVFLIYGNKNEETIIFRKYIRDLEMKYPENFSCIHILSHSSDDWRGFNGRINEDFLKQMLPELLQNNLADAEYFFCGPEGLMDAGLHYLSAAGVPKDKLHKESFVPGKTDNVVPVVDVAASVRTVKIRTGGMEYDVDVPPGEYILNAALDKGIAMPYSCQSGMCTACMGMCVKGSVVMDDTDALTPNEIKKGLVLTCVGRPLSDDVVIEIE